MISHGNIIYALLQVVVIGTVVAEIYTVCLNYESAL